MRPFVGSLRGQRSVTTHAGRDPARRQPAQQLLIGTLVTGMLGAGGFVLSPVPAASLAWVGATSAGAGDRRCGRRS